MDEINNERIQNIDILTIREKSNDVIDSQELLGDPRSYRMSNNEINDFRKNKINSYFTNSSIISRCSK